MFDLNIYIPHLIGSEMVLGLTIQDIMIKRVRELRSPILASDFPPNMCLPRAIACMINFQTFCCYFLKRSGHQKIGRRSKQCGKSRHWSVTYIT